MESINLDFYEAAHLDSKRCNLYYEKRQSGQSYAMIRITSCEHESWWYAKFIGQEVFVRFRYNNYGYGRFIQEAVCVYLSKTRITTGRSISAKDFIII
jgi:hypothetical protein